eukprot:730511-Pleurochrysis_carterae.AAC.1
MSVKVLQFHWLGGVESSAAALKTKSAHDAASAASGFADGESRILGAAPPLRAARRADRTSEAERRSCSYARSTAGHT